MSCPNLRPRIAKTIPWLLFVVIVVITVTIVNRQNTAGRDVLCRYANRQSAAARQDREALIVFATPRPPATMAPERAAIAKEYLDYGPLLYPPLDCADVRAGRNPPDLPPLPPAPLASAATSTTSTTSTSVP